MGLLVGLALTAIGVPIFYRMMQSAVRSGVEEALRNHYERLRAEDRD